MRRSAILNCLSIGRSRFPRVPCTSGQGRVSCLPAGALCEGGPEPCAKEGATESTHKGEKRQLKIRILAGKSG